MIIKDTGKFVIRQRSGKFEVIERVIHIDYRVGLNGPTFLRPKRFGSLAEAEVFVTAGDGAIRRINGMVV